MKDEPHGDETASTELVEEDEDDGPVELDDPFSGSENAKPVMLDGEEGEAEEATPADGDMDWYILKVQSNRETQFGKHFSDVLQCRAWIPGSVKLWSRKNKSLNLKVGKNALFGGSFIPAISL